MKYSYKKSACIGQFISVFYIGFEFKNNNTEKNSVIRWSRNGSPTDSSCVGLVGHDACDVPIFCCI